jgi:hypothetical protein
MTHSSSVRRGEAIETFPPKVGWHDPREKRRVLERE